MKKTLVALMLLGGLVADGAFAARTGAAGPRGSRPEGGLLDWVYGVRISNVVADPDTLEATFDVTEFMSSSYPYTTVYLGARTTFFGTYTLSPAIDFGDGSTVPPLQVPSGLPFLTTSTLDTVNGGTGVFRLYRGSFSHTYPAVGDYTVRTSSYCCADSPANTVTDGGVLTTFYFYTIGITYTYRVFYDTALVSFQQISLLEIPTASTAGLVALGLALLAAGFVVLRRS